MPFDPIPRFLKLIIIDNATVLFLALLALAAFGAWRIFKSLRRSNDGYGGRFIGGERAATVPDAGSFDDLLDVEHRMARLEDRLDFTERLIDRQERR